MGDGLHVNIPLSNAYSWADAAKYIADNVCPAVANPRKRPSTDGEILQEQNASHLAEASYGGSSSSPKGVDHRAFSKFVIWWYEDVEIYVETQEFCPTPEPIVCPAEKIVVKPTPLPKPTPAPKPIPAPKPVPVSRPPITLRTAEDSAIKQGPRPLELKTIKKNIKIKNPGGFVAP